jgi:hypothetical protein
MGRQNSHKQQLTVVDSTEHDKELSNILAAPDSSPLHPSKRHHVAVSKDNADLFTVDASLNSETRSNHGIPTSEDDHTLNSRSHTLDLYTSDSNPITFAKWHATGQCLTAEQVALVEAFAADPVGICMVKAYVEALAIRNQLIKIVVNAPPFEVSGKLNVLCADESNC